MIRRLLKWAAGIVLVLIGIVVLAIAVILIGANTGPGRRFIQNETASLTGGMVRIQGVAGRFPDKLRVTQIQVADAKGTYLTISNLIFDWSPLKLFQRTALIDNLQAAKLDFSRLPVSGSKKKTSSGSYSLPVEVNLRHLQIDQAVIGAPVAGAAATLALNGSADLKSLTDGTIQLDAKRLDSPGDYAVNAHITPAAIRASVKVNEPAKGLISTIAHLPDLGAIAVQASVDGPRDALATQADIKAGQLTASASGTIDMTHQAADLKVKAQAPAMAPAPGVSWQSVLVDATVRGPFTKPDVKGVVKIDQLAAAGSRIGALNANIKGNAGEVELHAKVSDLHVPGPKPDIFATSPVILDASAQLSAPDRPATFALHHPLLSLEGTAKLAGVQQVQAHIVLPKLAPLAAAAGTDLSGSTDLQVQATKQDGTTTASVKGRVAITGGKAPAPALIGDDAHIDVAASMHGDDIILSHLMVNGKALDVTAQGSLSNQKTIDANWTVALADLTAIEPSLSGRIDVKGHASGKLDDFAAQADIDGDLAAKGYSSGHITAKVKATGLPSEPHATITADGTLLDAPLSLALTADKAKNGTLHVDISQASWKSLAAGGALSLTPPAVVPTGNLHIDLGHLADLEPLLGRPLKGKATATLDSNDQAAKLAVTMTDVSVPGTAAINKVVLNATVTDPTGHPAVDGTLTADGVSAGAAKSIIARVTAKGPLDAVALTAAANAPDVAGGAAKFTTAGTLDAQAKSLALSSMEATWKQQVLRLLAPVKIGYSSGVSIDHLRLGYQQAELTLSGNVGKTLDLNARLRNLHADVASVINPAYAADGVIAAEAHLTGTTARPEGTVKLTATGVRQQEGPGQALPPADLVVNVNLHGTSARIDTKLTAGPSHVSVTGSAPLSKTGRLDLKTNGRIDLAMLNPLLTAEGRRAKGEMTINATVTGTTTAPRVRGGARLRNGDVTDYALGAHVTDLNATIEAQDDMIRLTHFSGKAGPGTLGGSGTVGLAGTMPVDLRFTANNARPIASPLLTELLDANVTVRGDLKTDVLAAGTVHIRRADIQIPDKLPASVAVLPVRNANAPPPPPPQATNPPLVIRLDLTVNAPGRVFIRGRGLYAELGGAIQIRGTSAKPIPSGGFKMRRGTLSVIGTTLNFTEGRVDFSGGGLTDPSIHFVATSTTATLVATLTVGGTAKDPKITLSSVPDMPQDEILAQLLFNTSTSKLSPLQLAEIASALAQLSGATSGFDPLSSLRGSLGLDRLNVGSDAAGNPTLQAGRYVAKGVYVGAEQSASGGGTEATVQVDLAKGLKLETKTGSGSTSATGSPSSGNASSIGLTYQFQY